MKKINKLLLVLLLVFSLALSAFALVACKENSGVDGTYYYGADGNIMKNNYYILKDKTWTDNGGSSGEYELNGASITLYVDIFGMKTEYMSGTVANGVLALEATLGNIQYYYKDGKITDIKPNVDPKPENKLTITYDANGGAFGELKTTTQTVDKNSLLTAPESPTRQNYTFSGWSKSKLSTSLWDFANDKATENTTLYAVWKEESARIFSVDGATITNYEIYLLVDKDTEIVSLSNKVVCSDDSTWKLYYDRLGQVEIPTKIAASASGSLVSGSNVFYVVVTSKDGTQTNLYTLDVYRSFGVNVAYYANDKVIHTDTAHTGYEYSVDYTPTIEGYTFNYWKNASGSKVTFVTPTSNVSIIADVTANEYKCTLDVNNGDKLDKTEYTFTYDQQFTLPRTTRTGYTFLGWYVGSTQLTNANGQSVNVWNNSRDITATAKWQANKYTVTAASNDTSLGTVTGGGEYDYDSRVTITATPKTGCNFVGWYDSEDKLVSDNKSYTFTMGFGVSYTAKFDAYTLTTSVSGAGTISKTYQNERIEVGTKITLTATLNGLGYYYLGWYDYDTEKLLTQSETYEFTMEMKNISLQAVFAIDDAMSCFCFTSTLTTCEISGLKDETITEIDIPDYVTSICSYAFSGCGELTNIIIPDSVKSIGYAVFSGCSSLESITLPFVGNSIKTSNDSYQYPFGYIFGTYSYSGGTATKQTYNSYQNKTTTTTYYIPTSLKSVTITGGNILYGAFGQCSNLTSISILDSVEKIENWAFEGCSSLVKLILPAKLKYVGRSAFRYCSSLTEVHYTGDIEGWCNISFDTLYDGYNPLFYAHNLYINGVCVTEGELIIPNTVTEISSSFVGCTNITSVVIPDSVTLIYDAFSGCSSLEEIKFDGTVAQWNAITKVSGWNSDVPATKVICSDGEVAL